MNNTEALPVKEPVDPSEPATSHDVAPGDAQQAAERMCEDAYKAGDSVKKCQTNAPESQLRTQESAQQTAEPAIENPSVVESSPSGDRFLPKLEVSLEVLSPEQIQFVNYLQESLRNLIPLVREIPDNLSESQKLELKQLKESIAKDPAYLQKEGKDQFGDQTKLAYKAFVGWLEQTSMPGIVNQFRVLGIEPPKGMPGQIISSENNSDTQSDNTSDSQSNSKPDENLRINLGINTNEVPTLDSLKTLNAAYDWLETSQQEVMKDVMSRQKEVVKDYIRKKEWIPKTWLQGSETDPNWTKNALEMIGLFSTTRGYVQAMNQFHKASWNKSFPFVLPPRAGTPSFDKQGNVEALQLDYPQTVDPNDPANREKIERHVRYLDQFSSVVREAFCAATGKCGSESSDGKGDSSNRGNKSEPLRWGDMEIHGLKARFDEKGNLLDLVDEKKLKPEDLKPGQELRKANLIEHRFASREEADGTIVVNRNIQAQNSHFYLNMRADNVGNPMELPELRLKPDEWLVVQQGNVPKLIQAKDLKSWKFEQQTEHYGDKVNSIIGDGSMFIPGAAVVSLVGRAAYVGARFGGIGAGALARQLAFPALDGLTKMTLGGIGIAFNNAGARDTEFGATVNKLLPYAYLGQGGLGVLKGIAGFNKTANAVETILRDSANSTGPSRFLPSIYSTSARIGDYAQYAYLPLLFGSIERLVEDFGPSQYFVENGVRLVAASERRTTSGASNKTEAPNVPSKQIQISDGELDGYRELLGSARPETVRKQIDEIMNRTRRALGADDNQQKELLRQKLAQLIAFTPGEVKELELAHGASLTGADLAALTDPNNRQSERLKPRTIARADEIMARRDVDVMRAATLALLILGTDVAGDELASITTDVPSSFEYNLIPSINGKRIPGRYQPVYIDEHQTVQNIDRETLKRSLYRQFEGPLNDGRRAVLAHAMFRTGLMSRSEYEFVARKVLKAS